MVRKSLLVFFCCVFFATPAWSALGIGDFTLGMPRQQVMDILKLYFPKVEQEYNLAYSVPMPYYRALEPSKPYLLGDVPIYVVEAYFNEADRLKQLSISFDTPDPERIKPLIPLMREARLVPDASGRHEVMFAEGELTYRVVNWFEWTTVEIADKPSSTLNIPMRARVDEEIRKAK